MSYPPPPAAVGYHRERIARMVEAATPFVAFIEVERVIAYSPLPPEQKVNLWTRAWSLLGPQRQEQQIRWITDQAAAYQPAL